MVKEVIGTIEKPDLALIYFTTAAHDQSMWQELMVPSKEATSPSHAIEIQDAEGQPIKFPLRIIADTKYDEQNRQGPRMQWVKVRDLLQSESS